MFCNVDRAREFMERHGLSAIVATTLENVAYLSDFDNPLPFYTGTNAAAVLPRDPNRPAIFVTAVAYLAHLTEAPTWMPETRVFGSLGVLWTKGASLPEPEASTVRAFEGSMDSRYPSLNHALAAALKDIGAAEGVIGIDDTRVADRLPEPWNTAKIMDATDILKEIRAVKTDAELVRLRRAAQINEIGFQAAQDAVKEGGDWSDVWTAWRTAWASNGGSPGFWGAGAGAHSAQIYPPFGNYTLKRGDKIRWEGGGWFGQYWADGGRTSVVGEADDRVKAYVKALEAGNTVAREVIRPGAVADDVCKAVLDAIRKSGIPQFPEENTWGHGIGASANELPRVRHGSQTLLQPGMVLCFETPYFEFGWGGIQMEDTYLVTPTGNDVLTKMDTKLTVLG